MWFIFLQGHLTHFDNFLNFLYHQHLHRICFRSNNKRLEHFFSQCIFQVPILSKSNSWRIGNKTIPSIFHGHRCSMCIHYRFLQSIEFKTLTCFVCKLQINKIITFPMMRSAVVRVRRATAGETKIKNYADFPVQTEIHCFMLNLRCSKLHWDCKMNLIV